MPTKKSYQWLLILIMFVSTSAFAQINGDTRTPGIFGPGSDPNRPVYNPDGSIRMPDGSVQYPDGRIIYPDGTVRYPNGKTSQPDQNRRPVYGNNQQQQNRNACNMPPGHAKKMYGDKSAKDYAHGKKQCHQKNRNERYDDDRYDDHNVRRYPQYPQSYPQYPQYPMKRNKHY
jgi:hypothetical protein